MPGPMQTNMARNENHIADFHKEGLAVGMYIDPRLKMS